jgi:hypothetical protein
VLAESKRLGHATPGFTFDTDQPVPGMQAQAASVFEHLVVSVVQTARKKSEKSREKRWTNTARIRDQLAHRAADPTLVAGQSHGPDRK